MIGKRLKRLSPAISHAYIQLIMELDERISEISATQLQKQLKCGPGCDGCCIQFSVLPLEAAIVAEAAVAKNVTAENNGESCSLLKDGLCSVYEVRPVICRTQGLPLAYIDEEAGAIEVSACPVNFPDDYPLSHDELMFMDSYNGRLAQLNVQYCTENDIDCSVRIPLADCVC
ncbi:YkgJ family cysteine cluster protein [Desulfosediminicola ganghwensis]|uniref:YkgJ family cysteine cluster protein n=1 Tax=Desulfosediminicola ganghwensis TaxID=2569540 RepID=UPI0010ABF9F0|nr:YkgJ family cysteine cluster protein [Desulfosediminicola ganghwensis]